MGLGADIDPHSLVEARKLIEVELAGLAAERATSVQIESIVSCLHRTQQTMEPDQAEELLQADVDFHFEVANASSNPILGQFLTLIRKLMREWILVSLSSPDAAIEAFQHHQQIVDAIRERERRGKRWKRTLTQWENGKIYAEIRPSHL
jgi:GntR family transcriptional repressor for pyruvate dehydrogenase complex